jgi:hypothetical protein
VDTLNIPIDKIKYYHDYLVTSEDHKSIIQLVGRESGDRDKPRIYQSTNYGKVWIPSDSGLLNTGNRNLLQTNNKIFYAGTPIFELINKDVQWIKSSYIGPGAYCNAMVNSYSNPAIFGAGGQSIGDNYFWLIISKDNGNTWTIISDMFQPKFGERNVTSLSFDKSDSILYVGTTNGILKIQLDQYNWSTIHFANQAKIISDPKVSGHLYFVAENIGLYKSTDYGNKWIAISGPYPMKNKYSNIAYDPKDYAIYIIFSVGIWRYKL